MIQAGWTTFRGERNVIAVREARWENGWVKKGGETMPYNPLRLWRTRDLKYALTNEKRDREDMPQFYDDAFYAAIRTELATRSDA